MATKRTNPKDKAPAEVGRDEDVKNLIDREVFDWGVRLTAHPFRGTARHAAIIISEIRNYRERRGSEVLISFPAVSMQKPLRLLDARSWHMALGHIIKETAAVQAEMRTTGKGKKG
jgi:hypothetical protein